MLSYVPISNTALQHLGEARRIVDADEDSKPARAIKVAWEPTRLFVLAEANWSYAIRTVELTARPDDTEFPVALGRKAFPLPADLVTLVEIVAPSTLDEEDSYSIEGGPTGSEILCDETGPITVRYVRDGKDIADPARWPPAFTEAFAFRLAWQISDELAADKGRKDRALGASEKALKLARRSNGRTKASRAQVTTPWAAARRNGVQRAPGV
jgi:hypothetical protein